MCRADRVKTKDNSPFPNDFNNHVSSEVYNYGFNAYKYIVAFKFQNECFDPEDKIEYLTTNYLAIIICYKQARSRTIVIDSTLVPSLIQRASPACLASFRPSQL